MHTNPEVLALVALGERDAATSEDLDHIAHCASCEQELSELGHLSQVGRTISDHFTLETPSPAVWNRIRDQLGFTSEFSSDLVPPPADDAETTHRAAATPASPATRRPLVAVPPPTDAPDSPPERIDRSNPARRRVLSLALAAALALLVGVGGTLAWQQLRSGAETVISAAQLNALPDWSGATGEATLEEDADGRRWLVVSMSTTRPVDGLQQVWLMNQDASSMVPVGYLNQDGSRLPVPAKVDVDRLPVVDVSDEPPDGPVTHSGNSIVRGTLDV
ncbi:MAG TPA: anti-sigma factor [Microlunatus sp.]|jgi:hypothetical protein|nr:anti-sigma factor [Microlunatus sp.]